MNYRRVRLSPGAQDRYTGLQRAAALEYEPGKDNAPRVTASGQGKLAEQIIALAKEHGVPIHEDPVLVAALSTVDLGEEIPPELYLVVAEVLAYIYRVSLHTRSA